MSAYGLGSRAIIGEFYMRIEAAQRASWIGQLAMRIESDQESETYKWLGMAPQLREWIGGRQAKGFRENGITIANKTFEGTLEVLVDELRRDKTGQVLIRVGELADRAVLHSALLLSTLINNAHAAVCYDGQYFFDTDHVEGDNTTNQANDITFDISDNATGGTPGAPTSRTMQAAILQGVAQILGFKDDQNEPMNETAREFLVMAPPNYMAAVLAAISNPVLDAGATNTITNARDFSIRAAINPRLGWTDKIGVFRADGRVKPFIEQVEEDITVQAIAEGSEEETKNNRHLYGVKRIGNVGYGYWQHACRVTIQA